MKNFRYDGRVAIVTGAGRGLGRSHALLLASRGARLIVNDLGGSTQGDGGDTSPADDVVNEIRAAGGEAFANYDSVNAGEQVVQAALDHFGRVDILINNAGILRDKSFSKMEDSEWEAVLEVHLHGAYKVTRAAWNHFKDQNFGRIIMTSSASGIYGNFGQAHYSAAKLALYGFVNTLAIEGKKYNILSNAIAPLAKSRMTEGLFSPELFEHLDPQYVSPLVAYLCHEDTLETGGLYEVAGGWIAKLRWERTQGAFVHPEKGLSIEDVAHNWAQVNNWDSAEYPTMMQDSFTALGKHLFQE